MDGRLTIDTFALLAGAGGSGPLSPTSVELMALSDAAAVLLSPRTSAKRLDLPLPFSPVMPAFSVR